MDEQLKNWAKHRPPGFPNLDAVTVKQYRAGLGLLALEVCEGFLDIPPLPDSIEEACQTDGLYYDIPFFRSDPIWSISGERTLLVVHKVEDRSITGVYRFDFKATQIDGNRVDYWIKAYDQRGERSTSRELVLYENKECWTMIPDHSTMKLSDYLREEVRA